LPQGFFEDRGEHRARRRDDRLSDRPQLKEKRFFVFDPFDVLWDPARGVVRHRETVVDPMDEYLTGGTGRLIDAPEVFLQVMNLGDILTDEARPQQVCKGCVG
jgi:hypothetical protein